MLWRTSNEALLVKMVSLQYNLTLDSSSPSILSTRSLQSSNGMFALLVVTWGSQSGFPFETILPVAFVCLSLHIIGVRLFWAGDLYKQGVSKEVFQ